MSNSLFRQKALKKLSSPEDLEQALAIIKPRTKIVIVGISLLVLFILIWGFTGNIPVSVQGSGILTSREGLKLVKAPFTGAIDTFAVNVGDTVEQGQVLASVEQLDLMFEIKKLDKNLQDVKEKYKRLAAFSDPVERRKKTSELKAERNRWKDSLSIYRSKYVNAETEEDEQLYNSMRIMAMQELEELNWLLSESENFSLEELLLLKSQINENQNLLNQKRSEYRFKTQLVSPYHGVVVETTLGNGDYFNVSHPVATIETIKGPANDLQAVIFVDASFSKRIKEGMKVLISPSTVAKEESGYMLGKVNMVGKYPSTMQGLFKIVKNEGLVQKLTEVGMPVYISVQLVKDEQSYSQYAWTSGSGPDTEILSGTLIEAKVILEEKKPISIVIPSINF